MGPLWGILLGLATARAEDAPPPVPDEGGEAPAVVVEPVPPADEEGWILLEAPGDFGSAVDSAMAVPAPVGTAETRQRAALRGRWSARPWLGVVGMEGAWAPAAGGVVGHQWWSLSERPLRAAGESALRATAPFGGLSGVDLGLESTAGAWLGPLGLMAGPALRLDRVRGDEALLPLALTLGPQARLAVRAGPVVPWMAATPAWVLVGERPALDAPWDELELAVGTVLDLKPVGFRLSGAWRPGPELDLWEAALGLHLRLL